MNDYRGEGEMVLSVVALETGQESADEERWWAAGGSDEGSALNIRHATTQRNAPSGGPAGGTGVETKGYGAKTRLDSGPTVTAVRGDGDRPVPLLVSSLE